MSRVVGLLHNLLIKRTMIATADQIRDIILNNPNRDYIAKNVTYHKDMRTHLYGEHVEGKIEKIDGMEDQALRDLRAKYVRTNKDLFSRLGRNMDKIFSARGGSTYYNLTEQLDKRAMSIALNIRDGYSVKKWIECYWLVHAKDDPAGLIFIEIGDGNEYPVGQAYPTYKAITDIYDYPPPKGAALDYVVFNIPDKKKKNFGVDQDGKLFRFVDDANDYLVLKNNDSITILSGLTIPNYFQKVPAMLNSDVVSGADECFRLSLFDEVIELANNYLLTGSIKVTHQFMHGFPKYWEYADDCRKCNGTGLFEANECPTCKGSGKSAMVKVSDIKLLTPPAGKDDPVIAPNVAGYVEPSRIYYEISTNELAVLEDAMNFTLWGVIDKKRATTPAGDSTGGTTKTATEILDDHQPMVSRLSSISESAEKRHKFIVDLCVTLMLKQPNYRTNGGASINYGRRYLIMNEDEIWAKYSDARAKGAPITVLNDLLRDFIETKYSGDRISKEVNVKLISVEPFVHMDITVAKNLIESDVDYLAKLYFWEWVNGIKLTQILTSDVAGLKESLRIFAEGKMAEVKMVREEKAALQPANPNFN